MAETVFLAVLLAQLGCAVLLLRSPARMELGFVLFAASYPLFLVALLTVDLRIVAGAWLALAGANALVQHQGLLRQQPRTGARSYLLASLYLWPVQYAGLRLGERQREESERGAARQRRRLGTLPATISGTVSYTHHVDVGEGEDMVWLEELEELELRVSSAKFDEIGLGEGRRVTVTIEEREEGPGAGKALWIVDGAAS